MNITPLIEAEQMLYACSTLEPKDMKSENMWLNNAGLYRRHLVLLKNTFEYHKYNHLKPASSKMIKYTMSWHSLFSGAMERLEDFENRALTHYDPTTFSAVVVPRIKNIEMYFFDLAHHFATKRRLYIEKKKKKRNCCLLSYCFKNN
tara:strand:- start:32 stop:472 length:441 start_codon:yes stop_codon:yes gene_type:complete